MTTTPTWPEDTTTATGTVVAIAIDLIDNGDGTPTQGEPYLEVWSPLGELRIPRYQLPYREVGDTVTITVTTGPAE